MKARDINAYFLDLAPWLDREKTVDRIIIGDPDREVHTCLVTWISSLQACRTAIERGVELLITHEPTFYHHLDAPPPEEVEYSRRKRELIERSGLVIMRNHDVWDRFPGEGVPWAWARFLGIDSAPVRTGEMRPLPETGGEPHPGTLHRYDIAPTTAGEFARRVAARTARLGEPLVQFVGPEAQSVSRIGIGTGCCCSPRVFLKMGCDCSVVCDDGTAYWCWLQAAEDLGHPVIRVNHGTSEEPAMMTLAEHVNRNLPGVRAEYLPHVPPYRVLGSAGFLGADA